MPTDAQWKREADRLYDKHDIVMFADWSYFQVWNKWVYVLGCDDYDFFRPRPLQQVDYFHGKIDGYVMGQMSSDEEENVEAKEMINLEGWTELAVTHIQRRWRTRVRASQITHGRLLPDPLCSDQGIARLVASYVPYEKASLQRVNLYPAEL